ncbi:MAG TPA: helix-turn-helix domain-containing protein [Anaerolineales bacterium]|nr:helix-turn-helix domain-containing protein [Anaerolineales bacterium]
MTTAKAAQHFDVSERTIRRWIKSGKLDAERTNGQWDVRVSECPSERPNDRESVRTDDRLTEPLQSEIERLNSQLERADFEIAHLSESLEEKTVENQRLWKQLDQVNEQLQRRDEHIESLTQEIDHLTQLLAMQTKTTAGLTDRLQAIEDLRNRPWWKRVFGG